jgi:hypothetical protein
MAEENMPSWANLPQLTHLMPLMEQDPPIKTDQSSVSLPKSNHRIRKKERSQTKAPETILPIEAFVPFKPSSLMRPDVRAMIVFETTLHVLYMQEQLPLPFNRLCDLAKQQDDHRSSQMKQITNAITTLQELSANLNILFRVSDVCRLVLCFGSNPRKAKWAVLLEFGVPTACTSAHGLTSSALTELSMDGDKDDTHIVDACARRLRGHLLQLAVKTPQGNLKASRRPSKFQIFFEARTVPVEVSPGMQLNLSTPSGGSLFTTQVTEFSESRLPKSLSEVLGLTSSSSVRMVRRKSGWPSSPWHLSFGETCPPSLTSASNKPDGFVSSAAAEPVSTLICSTGPPTKHDRTSKHITQIDQLNNDVSDEAIPFEVKHIKHIWYRFSKLVVGGVAKSSS